jgi:hypothetical protein
MSNLIVFEKESNPLLQKIKSDYSDLIKKSLVKNIAIVIPHSQCFNFIKQIDKSMIYSHILYINNTQWISMNGLKGTIEKEVIQVMTEDVTTDVLDPKNFDMKSTVPLYKIQILRQSDVVFFGKTIPLYLIAEPIRYKGCGYKSNPIDEEEEEKKKSFSFQDFVTKMKHKSVLPIVKKIKQFVESICSQEYKDNTPQIVGKFMREMEESIISHPHWKGASDLEVENAREGIEKYIMTKLHAKVFSPSIQDIQMDMEISNKLNKMQSIKPDNLDVPSTIELDPKWSLAIQELKKMNMYKTPRDKLVCISNCCKAIFGLIENIGSKKASADEFLPVLVYLICKSNVIHLHSNVKYIMDFRNPDRLMSEMGYHLTNLQSAIMFWQNVIPKELNLTQEEFDKLLEVNVIKNIMVSEEEEVIGLDTLPHEFYSYMDLISIQSNEFENVEFEKLKISDLKQVYTDYKVLLKMYVDLKEMSKKTPLL